ncbi:MAG: histidine phosphatase family protein, partial [Polaribacter sp.]|nr:histidine phosphatase family protein [Polaribacter sp.]
PLDGVYSTNYNRTQQTAKPTAADKNLTILPYNPKELYSSDFQKETFGKSILIVGHSNTTPAFVNIILGEKKYEDMSDDDNGSLYIVTIISDSKSVEIIKVE